MQMAGPAHMTTHLLCHHPELTMQVADTLSDKRMPHWAKLLGTRIGNTDWSDAVSKEEMLEQLLRLPAIPSTQL